MTDTKIIENQITDLIARELAAMEYELVRVKLTPGGRYLTLQIMAERQDRKPMTVEDCVKISHALSPRLDQADPLAGRYTLEVSSPGIERPLVRLQDFERFTGHVARIELDGPLGGRAGGQKRFQGSIVRVTGKTPDAEIEIKTESGEVRVPAKAIARARLVFAENSADHRDNTKH
jgi:ribosome maturation factor RimP